MSATKDIGRAVLELLGIDIAGVTGFDLHIDIHSAPTITLRKILKDKPNEGVKTERKYELAEVAEPKMTPPVNADAYEATDLATQNHWVVHQHFEHPNPLQRVQIESKFSTAEERASFWKAWVDTAPVQVVSSITYQDAHCPDCNGTRVYRGLTEEKPCPTCCGGQA